MPLTDAEAEKLLDELCDEFEINAKNCETPDFASVVGRVPPSLAGRLAKELFLVFEEIHGLEAMTSYIATQKANYPEYECHIEAAVSEIESQRHAMQETATSVIHTPKHPSPELKHYKLLQMIGEGGMGVVWMADQLQPVKRRVAVKIIKPNIGSDELIARFEAERQAVAMMDHPNIAKILDAGTTDSGQPFFAMELVKGLPLMEYCDANRLGLRDRLGLFRQVCDGVQHAHQKGLLHRDLKPANILVAEYNGQPVPKIIDFGLAKALESNLKLTEKSLFTEFGQVMGSFKYMSPEQAGLDSLDIDTRSDTYSLGVILYEMLTGGTPLSTDALTDQGLVRVLEMIREQDSPKPSNRIETTDRDALQAIAERRATDVNALRQSVTGDLDWIVVKTLEKNRTRRYDTVAQLSSDVKAFLDGDPVSARPPTLNYRLSKFVTKHKGFVASAALTTTLLLGGIGFSSWFAWQANQAKIAAEKSEERAVQNADQTKATLGIILKAFRDVNPDQGGSATISANDILRNAEAGIVAANLDAASEADVYRSLTLSYFGVGDYSSAVRTGRLAVQRRTDLFGKEDYRTKDSENDLARAFEKTGDLKAATELFERVHSFHLASVGPRHPLTLQLVDNLASAYAESGRMDEATALYVASLETGCTWCDSGSQNESLRHVQSLVLGFDDAINQSNTRAKAGSQMNAVVRCSSQDIIPVAIETYPVVILIPWLRQFVFSVHFSSPVASSRLISLKSTMDCCGSGGLRRSGDQKIQ